MSPELPTARPGRKVWLVVGLTTLGCLFASRSLERSVRPNDIVARIGGDEFAVLCDDVTDPSIAQGIAERIVTNMSADLPSEAAFVGASVGLAFASPADHDIPDAESLLHRADLAMYRVKGDGGRRVAGLRRRAPRLGRRAALARRRSPPALTKVRRGWYLGRPRGDHAHNHQELFGPLHRLAAVASVAVGDSDDLAAALHCSDLAGRLALEYFEAGVQATIKDDGSPVTEADVAVEDLLRTELGRLTPHDAILGEESGLSGESERLWILDPIDGTRSFAQGSPHWRVHVALTVGGHVEVAVVTAPALGLRWWGLRGHGAFESTWPGQEVARQLAVTRTAAMADAFLGADIEAARAVLQGFGMVTSPSTSGWCEGLMQLVRGEIDGFLSEGHKVWDHAPWILLVEESGGRFTKPPPAGQDGGGLYSNALLHDELCQAIGYTVN